MTPEKQLELIKQYDPEGYKELLTWDKVVAEDHLDYLAEQYDAKEFEEKLKQDPKFATRI